MKMTQTEAALEPLSENTMKVLVANHRHFRAFLAKRLGSDAIAEDLLQQSLKKAIEHAPASDERTSVLAWFYQILRRTLIDHYRSAASDSRKRDELGKALAAQEIEQVNAPDDLENSVCECLKGLLPTLKPAYADVLNRIDLGDESPDDVAARLGISRGNLDVRLHRARAALKTSLIRTCGTCTEHGCLNCTCNS